MTDTTPTAVPPKKMWTRCNGCQQRIYNDPLDIKIHAPLCPQNMLLALQKLNITVYGDKRVPNSIDQALVTRLDGLEEVVGTLDEHITAEPTLDPDGIDSDAYTDVVGGPEAPDEVPAETPVTSLDPFAYQPPVAQVDPTDLYSPHSSFGLNP